LAKLQERVYYLKVAGTPPQTIAAYFDNVSHKLNDLQPGIL